MHALVYLKKNVTAATQELIAFCIKEIASYKAPKSIDIVEEIPKTATGKILKKELRKKYWS